MRRFAEAGIRPRTKLGQNFLTDPNLQKLLVETAQLRPNDVVLEVGTGIGSVTELVSPRVAAVVTVEIDPRLFILAGEELHPLANVRMLNLDALESKHRLHPEMLEAVNHELAAVPGADFKLVANLPYVVATPIITNLLALDRPPSSMTVTVQKELADRLFAPTGSKEYGALSVWVQSQCQVQVVRQMHPSVFWPRPKVESVIVQITLDLPRRSRIADLAGFHNFVRGIFLHRRKILRAQLLAALQPKATKADVDRILGQAVLEPTLRAEQLDPHRLFSLWEIARSDPN